MRYAHHAHTPTPTTCLDATRSHFIWAPTPIYEHYDDYDEYYYYYSASQRSDYECYCCFESGLE